MDDDKATPAQTTLADARRHVRANWEEGVACPCCGLYVRLYKRKLNSSMARGLIAMHCAAGTNYINIYDGLPIANVAARQLPTTRYWKMVERPDVHKTDRNPRSGLYRLTSRGVDFVLNRIWAPRHVFVYNDRVRKIGDEHTCVTEALGDHFNYAELMGLWRDPPTPPKDQLGLWVDDDPSDNGGP